MNNDAHVQCPNCGRIIIDEGVDRIVCPDCNSTFQRDATPSAAIRLNAPGWALIATACLGIVGNCVLGLAVLAIPRDPIPMQAPEGIDDATWQAQRNGQLVAPGINVCLATLPVLFVYPVVMLAGIQMRKRRNYMVCVMGSMFAVLPCSLAFLVGLPCGIWALSTLLNRQVRDVFRNNS